MEAAPEGRSSSQGLSMGSDSEGFGTPRSDLESVSTAAGISPSMRSMRSSRGSRGGGQRDAFRPRQEGLELRDWEGQHRDAAE